VLVYAGSSREAGVGVLESELNAETRVSGSTRRDTYIDLSLLDLHIQAR
jgi:hypothetical protein